MLQLKPLNIYNKWQILICETRSRHKKLVPIQCFKNCLPPAIIIHSIGLASQSIILCYSRLHWSLNKLRNLTESSSLLLVSTAFVFGLCDDSLSCVVMIQSFAFSTLSNFLDAILINPWLVRGQRVIYIRSERDGLYETGVETSLLLRHKACDVWPYVATHARLLDRLCWDAHIAGGDSILYNISAIEQIAQVLLVLVIRNTRSSCTVCVSIGIMSKTSENYNI